MASSKSQTEDRDVNLDSAHDIKETLNKLNMTSEEVNQFEKAFQDPKFKQMFEDYTREISNPEARAESEQYLRQLEKENQAQSIYGADVQLIVPEPAFVVKTKTSDTQQKVFINICTSEKVQKAESEKATVNGQTGNTWNIPFSLGEGKVTKDKSGNDSLVYDFVLHPETQAQCIIPPFREMVVHTAIENIEKAKNLKLERTYAQLKMKYKTSDGIDKPGVQAVRMSKSNPNAKDAIIKPKHDISENFKKQVQQQNGSNEQQIAKHSRSPFSFDKAISKSDKAPIKVTKGQPGYVYDTGEKVPEFTIVQRGEYDILDMWGDVGKAISVEAKRPKELIVKVELPGIKGVSDITLEVTMTEILIEVPGTFKLDTRLPYEVYDKKGKARFDKHKRELTVTLPVVPPKKPDPKPFIEPITSKEDQPTPTEEKGKVRQSPAKDNETNDVTEKASKKSDSVKEVHIPTENERVWKEMHAHNMQKVEEVKLNDADSSIGVISEIEEIKESSEAEPEAKPEEHAEPILIDEEALSRGEDFVECPKFSGAINDYVFKIGDKGLGYYKDVVAVTSTMESSGSDLSKNDSNKSLLLKPSLTTALWDDID